MQDKPELQSLCILLGGSLSFLLFNFSFLSFFHFAADAKGALKLCLGFLCIHVTSAEQKGITQLHSLSSSSSSSTSSLSDTYGGRWKIKCLLEMPPRRDSIDFVTRAHETFEVVFKTTSDGDWNLRNKVLQLFYPTQALRKDIIDVFDVTQWLFQEQHTQ